MWKRNTCTQQTNAFICGLENRLQYVRVQLKLCPRFSFLSVSPLLKEPFSSCSFPAYERIRFLNLCRFPSLLISLPAILVCSITPQTSFLFFFVWIFHFFLFRVFIFLIVLQRRLQLVQHCDDIRIVFLVMVDLLLRAFFGQTVHVLRNLLHLFFVFLDLSKVKSFSFGLSESDWGNWWARRIYSWEGIPDDARTCHGLTFRGQWSRAARKHGHHSWNLIQDESKKTFHSHFTPIDWQVEIFPLVERWQVCQCRLHSAKLSSRAVEALVTLEIHRKKFLPSAFSNCDINKRVSSSWNMGRYLPLHCLDISHRILDISHCL